MDAPSEDVTPAHRAPIKPWPMGGLLDADRVRDFTQGRLELGEGCRCFHVRNHSRILSHCFKRSHAFPLRTLPGRPLVESAAPAGADRDWTVPLTGGCALRACRPDTLFDASGVRTPARCSGLYPNALTMPAYQLRPFGFQPALLERDAAGEMPAFRKARRSDSGQRGQLSAIG